MNYQSIDWAPVPGFVLVGREAREYMQEDYEELSFVLLGVDGRTYVCYEDYCCLPQEQETVVQVRLDGQVVETYHMPGVGSDLKGIRRLPSALALLFPYFYVPPVPSQPVRKTEVRDCTTVVTPHRVQPSRLYSVARIRLLRTTRAV